MEDNAKDTGLLEGLRVTGEIGEAGQRQVGQSDTQTYWQKHIRLQPFDYCDKNERRARAQHQAIAPVYGGETRLAPELQEFLQDYTLVAKALLMSIAPVTVSCLWCRQGDDLQAKQSPPRRQRGLCPL